MNRKKQIRNLERRVADLVRENEARIAAAAEPRINLDLGANHRIADRLDQMVSILSRMERKQPHGRRPRNILCQHPELHPDDPDAVAFIEGQGKA